MKTFVHRQKISHEAKGAAWGGVCVKGRQEKSHGQGRVLVRVLLSQGVTESVVVLPHAGDGMSPRRRAPPCAHPETNDNPQTWILHCSRGHKQIFTRPMAVKKSGGVLALLNTENLPDCVISYYLCIERLGRFDTLGLDWGTHVSL